MAHLLQAVAGGGGVVFTLKPVSRTRMRRFADATVVRKRTASGRQPGLKRLPWGKVGVKFPTAEVAMSEQRDWNQQVIDEFRANGGNPLHAPLLLLHTRPTPHPADLPLTLSQAAPSPFLLANPDAQIEVGTETLPVHARVAEGEERERIYETQKQRYPTLAEYEKTTAGREIPVIILTRKA